MENSSRILGRISLIETAHGFIPAPPPSRRCRNSISRDGHRACGAYLRKDGGGCPNARHHAAS